MKLSRVFHAAAPRAPVALARQPALRRLATLLFAVRRRWALLPRVEALDFQDTQPAIRETGSTLPTPP